MKAHTTIFRIVFILFFVFANLADMARLAADDAKHLSVCFYDCGFFSSSSEKKETMILMLSSLSPDILVLSGIKDRASLELFKQSVKSANFADLVEAEDKERHLGIVSNLKPVKFIPITDQKYSLKDVELPVRRGFLHCVFNIDGYILHLVAAHLQEREKVEGFNQTDMRRYEARLLRYYITSLLKNDMQSNILVAGNMNDTCGMATIKEIYNRRFDVSKRLFDVRPIDDMRTSWTFWNSVSDEYERIDYFMATSALLPEISRKKTFISQDSRWKTLSKHRPIVVTIKCKNEHAWSNEQIKQSYPNAIYEGQATHFEEDKPVGEKPKRNPPTTK